MQNGIDLSSLGHNILILFQTRICKYNIDNFLAFKCRFGICTGHELCNSYPNSKVHGANMGPIWGRQDPGGPHVGPMNFAICVLAPNGVY